MKAKGRLPRSTTRPTCWIYLKKVRDVMHMKILRVEISRQGALGVLLIDAEAFCCTLQPDDKDLERFFILDGDYLCQRFHGTKWKNTFEIIVKGHTALLFHAGNVEAETIGCTILGSSFGKLKGQRAVLNSGTTFEEFLKRTARENIFTLSIRTMTAIHEAT